MQYDLTTSRVNPSRMYSLLFLVILCLLDTLFGGTAAYAKNSFLVAPGRIDFDLSRPHTQSFIITNDGDGPIRLSIAPDYFEVNSKTLSAGEPLVPESTGQDSLEKYVRVSPRTLSLAPGQRRDVRVSLRAPAELPEGDYRVHLMVRMKEIATTINSATTGEDGKDIGMKLNIKMETGVAIYGYKGERNGRLGLVCHLTAEGPLVDVTNPTPWRYEGVMQFFPQGALADAEPLHELWFNSLRETQRAWPSDGWVPESGQAIELRWSPTKTLGEPGQTDCQSTP